MIVVSKIEIDLTKRPSNPIQIDVTQGDTNTRKVAIALYEHGKPWIPPAGVAASVRYRKPDDTSGLYNTLPDGSAAYEIIDNEVIVILAPQMLTVPGRIISDVWLTDGENNLATFSFTVRVEKNPLSGGTLESEDYFNAPLLPAVTSADAGKFLRVSQDGTWCVQALTNVEEVGA